MSDTIDQIANAVMYEGHVLYPYRPSTKNRYRFTFGTVFPGDSLLTQCLMRGGGDSTRIDVKVRFLQPIDRDKSSDEANWQDVVERSADLDLTLADRVRRATFSFPNLQSAIDLSAHPVADGVVRLTVLIENLTPRLRESSSRDRALIHAMASTHALIRLGGGGQLVSAIDPPPELKDLSRACRNEGLWPVLVGEAGATDAMLAAPIILYDYPQIAPESPGDLFDGTEIDEILSLRILTLTDDEKRAAATLDDRTAELVRRTESLARDQLAGLHGTMRPAASAPPSSSRDPHGLRAGDRVRLSPRRGADAFDIILTGKTATIVAVEEDYEGRVHVAVTIDDDPGADIGAAGKIGHRFYFRPDELDLLQEARTP